ncbi:hypothetical protein BDAP_001106 [Binucleata daphniae]
MYNYLSQVNNDIFIIKEKQLITYNTKTKQVTYKSYDNNIIYIKHNYVIDQLKNMYDFTNDFYVTKLQKNITILQYKDKIYICNRFGDVNTIENNKIYISVADEKNINKKSKCNVDADKQIYTEKLLFGNLCLTTCMILHDFIWTGDKYGRIRVSEYSGKIMTYIFLNNFIVCMEMYNNKMYVFTKGKEHDELHIIDIQTYDVETYAFSDTAKKIIVSKYLYIIGSKGIYKCANGNECNSPKTDNYFTKKSNKGYIKDQLIVIDFIEGDFIDGIVCENEIFLTTNGNLLVNNKTELSLDYTFSNDATLFNK